MEKLSDKEIWSRIRQNDKLAFRYIFDRYYKELLGTAINILKDLQAAKDAVQEVFFQIWKNRMKIELRNALGAYLKRAVINRALNQVKRQKPFVDTNWLNEKASPLSSALDDLALAELKSALDAALDTLPERCRIVFVMKRLEGMSQKEIATALQISPKTVENQMTKALKVLHKALRIYQQQKTLKNE